jgi:UDP-N-acetylglucosamine 3-dehydrogenase
MSHSTSQSQPSKSTASNIGSPKMALIGCGAIAERYYLPALARHPSVMQDLILVDRLEERARELAARFHVKTCLADYRLIPEAVEGAIIAVPTHLHYPISMEFLSRGVHVLCEKPLAESADNAQQMVEEARKTKAILVANYQRRLYPNLVKVKELVTNRALGEPLSVKYYVGEKFAWPSVSGFYFNAKLSSRGVLRDRGAHVMDVICWWLGGKPELISSQNDCFGGSEAVAHIRFRHNMCIGEVKLSWLSKFPCSFIVECEAGTIRGDIYNYRAVTVNAVSGRARRVKIKSGPMSYSDMAHTMVTNFIQVINQNEKPLVSGGDVLDSIQFVDECYAAATEFDMPWYDVLEVHSGS